MSNTAAEKPKRAYVGRPNPDDPARRGLLKLKEIADRLGISEARVQQLHASALRKLRIAIGRFDQWT